MGLALSYRRLVTLSVNGREHELDVPVSRSLLDVLREDIGLTGAKECCAVGECGACTVLVDGLTVNVVPEATDPKLAAGETMGAGAAGIG